jgi:hypothetical protein
MTSGLARLSTLADRLVGAEFWDAGRTLDMAEFSFGQRRPIPDRHGDRVVGESRFACAVRMANSPRRQHLRWVA